MPVKKTQVQEESGGEKAPLWIISFADMISLLMAFFVMLQTMACERSNELFNTGMGKFEMVIGEFQRHIDGFGAPGLFGRPGENLGFKTKRSHYQTDIKDEGNIEQSAIDSEQEKTGRLFAQLSNFSNTHRSQLMGNNPNYIVTPITFEQGQSQLNSEARMYLINYAAAFRHPDQQDNLVIYIVGCAPDVSPLPRQWIVSEQRAAATAAFLKTVLPENTRDNVFWWGAGSSKGWLASTTNAENQPRILIAIIHPAEQ